MSGTDPAFAPGALPDALAPGIADTMQRMGGVFVAVARRIARGGLEEDLAGAGQTNADGDTQKALDVIADDAFRAALAGGAVRHYASEEQDSVVTLAPGGGLALAIDPLDGSSNIDTNVSIGTIFGLYPAADGPEASFLRPGRELLAAGYAIYGPQCALVVSFGQGVLTFVLDPLTGRFHRLATALRVPEEAGEYAINASNRRHWQAPVRQFIAACEAGETGPLGSNFNMRWVASLVAETHRILTRGGVFLYPGDARPGYGAGRLRLVYECAPVAFLVEQAGGAATDGAARLLDRVPDRLHARAPLVFGSRRLVAAVADRHAEKD